MERRKPVPTGDLIIDNLLKKRIENLIPSIVSFWNDFGNDGVYPMLEAAFPEYVIVLGIKEKGKE